MKTFKYYRSLLLAMVIMPGMLLSFSAIAGEVVASGTFVGASGHETRGGVSVVKDGSGLEVVLAGDFFLDGAPDPKVGFGKDGDYDSKSQLAHLKANAGKQEYKIPGSVNVSDYNEIYIWCEKFSVPLGIATLN